MTILLLGKNGQVGWELQRALQPLGHIIALDRHRTAEGLCGDIADFAAITHAIETIRPAIVVNASAYTAVDRAESDAATADLINHQAVRHLAEQCRHINALLVHYSTDYIFSGQGTTAWQENSPTSPINTYGRSKRAGEEALEQSGVDFFNFRTSWVYGLHGNNFIKTMLKLGQTKDTLSIISDQIGAPTSAALIADITAHSLAQWRSLPENTQHTLTGHYHLAAAGTTSWFDYAQLIFATARAAGIKLTLQQLSPIATKDYPTPAPRPLNSRLNTHKLQHTFALHLPDWQLGVTQTIQNLLESIPS